MLQTIEALLEPDGRIHLLEKLNITRPTKVLLTVLETIIVDTDKPVHGSGAAILEFLRKNPLKPQHRRSVEAIQHDIEQERNAWD